MGGIAGTNLSSGTINNCTTTGSVYGAHFIGGIVGENHGVVINCGNDANVNTTVDQNEVDLSELTLNDLIGTENAADITDIGGIAGTSSAWSAPASTAAPWATCTSVITSAASWAAKPAMSRAASTTAPSMPAKRAAASWGQMEPSAHCFTPRTHCRSWR